jgi:hypothetical protein
VSDIEKQNNDAEKHVELHKDRIGSASRLTSLGAGIVCLGSGLFLSFQGTDPAILHTVFLAGISLFGLAVSGKIFSKD